MNWLFRRHFWIVNALFLCIVAILTAKIFTTILGYWVSKHIPQKPSAMAIVEPEPLEVPKNYSLANERNLFKARREQISLLDEPEEETEPGRWQDAQLSSLPLKLVSTMVFSNPYDSRAVIQNQGAGSTGIFSIGECGAYKKKYNELEIETVLPPDRWEPNRPCNSIDGIASVRRIEEYRVYIFNERDRRFEYLSLLPDDRRLTRPMARPESFIEEEGEGIRKTGPTSYEIEQSEFDKALGNIGRLMTEARAVPELDSSGKYVGFKLVYVKENSLFEKIGIERMDVITRINGYELNSPEAALQLFGKLKTASQFTIDLKRSDRAVTLDYSVIR